MKFQLRSVILLTFFSLLETQRPVPSFAAEESAIDPDLATWISAFEESLDGQPALKECRAAWTDRPPFYLTGVDEVKTETYTLGVLAKNKNPQNDPRRLVPSERDFTGKAIGSGKRPLTAKKFYTEPPVKGQSGSPLIIPRGSWVQSTDSIVQLTKGTLTRVKVLQARNIYLPLFGDRSARNGDLGFIETDALHPVEGSSVFVLKKNAVLMSFGDPVQRTFPSGTLLRPVVKEGKYKVNVCKNDQGKEIRTYMLNILDGRANATSSEVGLTPSLSCGDLSLYSEKDINTLLRTVAHADGIRLTDMEINDFGMVRLPFETVSRLTDGPEEITEVKAATPDRRIAHYQTIEEKGEVDIWVNPHVLCQIDNLADAWSKTCDNAKDLAHRCTIMMGDAAFITPTWDAYSKKEKDLLGHHYHYSGNCVDIRPMRKDVGPEAKKFDPIFVNGSGYDRALTKALIDQLQKLGAAPIYFGDRKLTAKGAPCDPKDYRNDLKKNGVIFCGGHSNHIHACFEKSRVPSGCRL